AHAGHSPGQLGVAHALRFEGALCARSVRVAAVQGAQDQRGPFVGDPVEQLAAGACRQEGVVLGLGPGPLLGRRHRRHRPLLSGSYALPGAYFPLESIAPRLVSGTARHRLGTTEKGKNMNAAAPRLPGGTWNLGDLSVTRFGYGAMQLAGPGVMGPPADREGAIAVLREAVDLGITHIDTSDAYGPHVTNRLIREALHPYPESLRIATKVGAHRDADGGWPPARRPEDLRRAVHENLETLGVEALDLVNLRLGDAQGTVPGSIAEPFEALGELQRQGLIRHLGVSNATAEQVAEARSIARIECVQNMYNLAHRHDDGLIDELAADGIAYVPFF